MLSVLLADKLFCAFMSFFNQCDADLAFEPNTYTKNKTKKSAIWCFVLFIALLLLRTWSHTYAINQRTYEKLAV